MCNYIYIVSVYKILFHFEIQIHTYTDKCTPITHCNDSVQKCRQRTKQYLLDKIVENLETVDRVNCLCHQNKVITTTSIVFCICTNMRE